MSLEKETVSGFLDDLASDLPAPGGGSVAALGAALASALVSMVSNLTIGKEKYQSNWEKVKSIVAESEKLRAKALSLMNDDVESFNSYMAALKLPKETEEQKSARKEELEKAAKLATEAPLSTLELCARIAALAVEAAEYGNTNAATDAGSAALFADAAGKAAALNVRINLPGIKDGTFVSAVRERMFTALKTVSKHREMAETMMDKILKQ